MTRPTSLFASGWACVALLLVALLPRAAAATRACCAGPSFDAALRGDAGDDGDVLYIEASVHADAPVTVALASGE